jgi:hypothetical protein
VLFVRPLVPSVVALFLSPAKLSDELRTANCELQNYFNYFTEIEEHFQRRRGTALLLSTLDWALIETWKDAGIPLEAVLRGIDAAFEKFDNRPRTARKVNSLAYCAQAVLTEAEEMKEAAVGAAPSGNAQPVLDRAEIAAYLQRNAAALNATVRDAGPSAPPTEAAGKGTTSVVPTDAPKNARALAPVLCNVLRDAARKLADLAQNCASANPLSLEDLERTLTVLEEKIFAALTASASDDDLLAARTQAEREMAPYRRSMSAAQIDQLQKQYVHKRLLDRYSLPRLSLFYM